MLALVTYLTLITTIPIACTSNMDVVPAIEWLFSSVQHEREAAFQSFTKKPPLTFYFIVDYLRRNAVNCSDWRIGYRTTLHLTIQILGHHRVKSAIPTLMQCIGCGTHNYFVATTGTVPSIVQALSRMGDASLPYSLVALGGIKNHGEDRTNCLHVIFLLHHRDSEASYRAVKQELECANKTDSEKENLQAALNYFHVDEQSRRYIDFRDPKTLKK